MSEVEFEQIQEDF